MQNEASAKRDSSSEYLKQPWQQAPSCCSLAALGTTAALVNGQHLTGNLHSPALKVCPYLIPAQQFPSSRRVCKYL